MKPESVVARESQHTKPTFKLGYCTAHAETNCKICHALTYDASDISDVCYNCLNGGHSICHEEHCRCRDKKHKAWWWVARESQHTQLPWEVVDGGNSHCELEIHSEDSVIAFVLGGSDNHLPLGKNAEFIVRACNAHEKLVEALQAMLRAYQLARSENLWDDPRSKEQAEQALRLAQGGQ